METVCTLSHHCPSGELVLDFVVGVELAGWYRHEFDARGRYVGVGRAAAETVRAELDGDELRGVAGTLEAAVGGLLDAAESSALEGQIGVADALAARAGAVERERLRLLDACEPR